MLVRPLEDADWVRFLPILRGVVSAGETYAYPEDLTSAQARELWAESPLGSPSWPSLTTARCSGRRSPNRPSRGSHVATASFMVAPEARGMGVGPALAEWVITWAREHGYAAMQFNAVVETNTAAVALWRDLGFEVIGTVPRAFDSASHGHVGLHVRHRYL